MPPVVRLRVFGGLRLWRSGAEIDLGAPRPRTVLAALIAARGAVVGTGELIDLVWGDRPSPSAVNQLHRLIGQVRRLFEPDLPSRMPGAWVRPAGDGYRLPLDGRTCDLVAFSDLVAAARAAARQSDVRAATRRFEQALPIAQEPPFAGLPPAVLGRPAFVALDVDRVQAAVEAADLAVREPHAHRLLPLITRYAAAAPLHEPLHARVVRLLTATGRRAEALAHFEQVRRRLADELGADPGTELRAAHLEALAEPAGPDAGRPAQLPPRVIGFSPRDDLAHALDAGRRAPVVVLSGMGGVGKTALAVDWAHRVAHRYPDGQLYLNLRGFDPGGRQLTPLAAVDTLLESVGVDLATAGDGLDARSARFRSALAGRRMLVLLDNARDSAQVRPLLPGSAGCLAVVTSRNRLTGLVAHEGAHPVHVGRLRPGAAHDLLTRRLGAPRLGAEPAAAAELVRLCAGLPLALAVAAARVAVRPDARLADVVADLTAARRLDALATGERHDDVRSAFSWSYATLSAPAARLFRVLAVLPGAEFSTRAAASVAGTDVRGPLAELTGANMVTELGAGRFTVHDLLHAYAMELLDAEGDERTGAERRLVEHYVRATRTALLAFRLPPPAAAGPESAGVSPPPLADVADVLTWYARERAALTGTVDLALDRGWARDAALISLHLRPIRSARVESAADSRDQVLRLLAAVEKLGDPELETPMLRDAAIAVASSEPERAHDFLTRALALAERSGDLIAQSLVLKNLAAVSPRLGGAERVALLRRAVGTARRSGDASTLVYALDALASKLPDPAAVAGLAREAFELAGAARMDDFRPVLAARRAEAALSLGDHPTAIAMAEWALAHTPPGDNFTPFPASVLLAEAAHRAGDPARARAAAELFRELLRRHGPALLEMFGDGRVVEYRTRVDAMLPPRTGPATVPLPGDPHPFGRGGVRASGDGRPARGGGHRWPGGG